LAIAAAVARDTICSSAEAVLDEAMATVMATVPASRLTTTTTITTSRPNPSLWPVADINVLNGALEVCAVAGHVGGHYREFFQNVLMKGCEVAGDEATFHLLMRGAAAEKDLKGYSSFNGHERGWSSNLKPDLFKPALRVGRV